MTPTNPGDTIVARQRTLEGELPDDIFLSPTALLRSALPAGEVHPAMWQLTTSSTTPTPTPTSTTSTPAPTTTGSQQACDNSSPHLVLRWDKVEPPADEEAGGGGGGDRRRLIEAIREHQEAADALYGARLRLYRPPSAGPLNSAADVGTALAMAATGHQTLGRFADALLLPAGARATWCQQPAAVDITQGGVASGGGGAAAGSGASNARRFGADDSYDKMNLVLLIDEDVDPLADAAAAGSGAAGQQQPGRSAGGGRRRRPAAEPPLAAAAKKRRTAGGNEQVGGGGSAGGGGFGGGTSLPAVEEQAAAGMEVDPAPAERRRQQPRCVCVGEVQLVPRLMEEAVEGEGEGEGEGRRPIDLLAAWHSREHGHHSLARAVISKVYTRMVSGGDACCYGFISCYLATWLAQAPLQQTVAVAAMAAMVAVAAVAAARGGNTEEPADAAGAAPAPAPAPAPAALPGADAAGPRRRQRPPRVLLRFNEDEELGGGAGLVMGGSCDGVPAVIKLLGPDRAGLVAYDREVAAYAALEGLQGAQVPELLAWGDVNYGVRFLAQAAADAAPRCVLLDFGRSWLDGGAAQQRRERRELRRLLAATAAAAAAQQEV
ncbi:hypothetical protein HXX76_009775 [Chlamydomonas incerta]|uniref:Protein kinase domain-containing protein n=1 Tax=Chlamydomonas incerta TaxID=51695 RepID=A0A835VYZ0_CHLIN|nr:hypothetical protein HXX76_009775 [Chlamydomonas incerta]|eukprot:KAG2430799.1 hypothetical protein HXX76_009775 [Chlamydomonas incerta]